MKKVILPPLIIGVFALLIVNYYANIQKGYESETTLLIDENFLPSMMKDIYSAKSSIICSLYLFKVSYGDISDADSGVTMIFNLLKDKAKQIDVTLIFDPGDTESKYNPNKQTAQLFKGSNVKVFFTDGGRRLYSKVCVIDKSVTYIGSHNLTYSSFELNNESSVRIKSAELGNEVYNYLQNMIKR